MRLVLKLFSLFLAISGIFCGNILFMYPVISGSHTLWHSVLGKQLAKVGHNVTFLTFEPDKGAKVENFHPILIENVHNLLFEEFKGSDSDASYLDVPSLPDHKKLLGVIEFCIFTCRAITKSPKGLDIILNYPDDFKFDLIIHDTTCGPCMLPIAKKFKYPSMVGVTPFINPPSTINVVGGHKYPAYVPHFVNDSPQVMNFIQRLHNTYLYWVEKFAFKYQMYPELERLTREKFKFKDMPPLIELEQKTKLILLNADNAIDYPEPLQPNMILVGGLQITEPKDLPTEMKTFVESGKKGTVLMSLGTNIMSSMLGEKVLTTILKTFESIPDYNFIWKFEAEPHELPVKPAKNVMVAKFLPQNDLLAHKHLKAFITHAGGLSTQESLWYGKPMVGIPFIADQYRTVDKSVRMGVAIKLEIATLEANNFKNAIMEVLENPKYTENARKISRIFQDKPMKPLDTAIYWIEFVMRNPDAPFFKSPTLELGFLASNSLDIYLFLLFIIHLILFIAYRLIRKIFRSKSDSKKVKVN